ncbi:MAG: helix-turn-helix domain-containing protein [Nanoarchaeota archaeon]|nr:helix-turn-helix domain-containing protein [Nanoarchaeota archaeon]
MKSYLLKEKEGRYLVSEAILVDNPESLKLIDHPIRIRILNLLAKRPMYPAELAKELRMHEQKVYYHIKQMSNSGLLDIVERQEIRGTTAKKFAPKALNFGFSLSKDWKDIRSLLEKRDREIESFLFPFVKESFLDASIVVGSPDPHGPHKARARDGHYAIDLALFLGQHCTSDSFSAKLDVDIDLKTSGNLILVGGPVTNLVVSKLNEFLPAKFSDDKPWGIISKLKTYTEESVGMVCRFPNPFNPEKYIMVIAGIRFIGTKAAVLAITKHTKQVIYRFTGQKEFCAIVQGFDLDADGKIDSIEVLE